MAANPLDPSLNPYGYGDGEDSEQGSRLDLIERIFAAVLNHRWWLLGSIAGALTLGLLLTFIATPQYSSTTRVEILPYAPVETSVSDDQNRPAINNLEFYNTQYSLLKSRSLADRVVRAGNLLADKDFRAAFEFDGDGGVLASNDRRQQAEEMATLLLDLVEVEPVRASSLVDVTISTPSPRLSAKLADLWAKQFIAATLDRRFAGTSAARRFLEDRLTSLRQSLEQSERALVNYSTNNQIVTLATETNAEGRTRASQTLVGAEITAITAALARARENRAEAESNLASTLTGAARVNSLAINNLRQRRAEVASELARLSITFEDDYPGVVSLRAQLEALDRGITAEEARSSRGNRETYEAAVKREQDLQSQLDDLTDRYTNQQRQSIELAILQREVDSNRQLYEGLLQRFKEIGAAGVGANNISIVDAPKIETRPSSPSLILNLAIALLLGTVVGAGLVFLLEQMDSSIRDPQSIPTRFGVPLLGSIPKVADGDVFATMSDKKSEAYEAYLSLMTNLSFLTDHGAPKVIMMTSSRPAEGKSNSAISIATVLASSNKSVILVDADVRNPSLNRYLDISNQKGLSHYLTGDDDLASMIKPFSTRGFSVITAGKTPPNAAEILGLDRLSTLLDTLSEQYDHVIVDAPPVLGLADAPLISRRVEGVLFVVEANSTRTRAIGTALSRLRMAGARIFGVVVTKVGRKNQIYGYGYGYGHGYGYGASRDAE